MTPNLQTLDALRSLVPADSIAEREAKPCVSPNTTEEVAAVARCAHTNNFAIEIVGAGTKRGWGNPVQADILLDTTRLTGVRQHSWQDLTATVAAGTPWAAMQRTLAAHNQFVALDPLWPEAATVGGILACNDSGALRLRYGSLRDLIIGMTIVLADGTIARSGGKVVKNVAGYDLHKLMTGAFGTLGIITEVNFRLHPIPKHSRTWAISSPAVDDTAGLMLKVLNSHLSTQAMQLRADASGFSLDVQLASLPEALADQIERLEQLARTVGIVGASCYPSTSAFGAREELFSNPASVVIKVTMLPTGVANLSADVVRLGGSAVTQSTGIMLARFTEEAAAAALPSLYAYVDAEGGELTMLRARHPRPEWAIPPWGPDKTPPLMREIKRQFDPNRILNPGRFLGGI